MRKKIFRPRYKGNCSFWKEKIVGLLIMQCLFQLLYHKFLSRAESKFRRGSGTKGGKKEGGNK